MMGTKYTYYKLKHSFDDTKECFIGSTDNINKQKTIHKNAYTNLKHRTMKLYKYIRENDGLDEWEYDLLETKLCETPYQRYTRESELIKQHNATLHTYDTGSRAVDFDDDRNQICGRCGSILRIRDTSTASLNKHRNTLKCKNATPPVIDKGKHITIIKYMVGKKQVVIEGTTKMIHIHD